jgi:flagellar biosynthesis/type III secretory pathway chaperone
MNPQQAAQLNTLLMQGISLLESLSNIYDKELETLSNKDLKKLSDVTQEKTDLLNKFHRFTQDRQELLESFGITQDSQSYQLPEGTAETAENKAVDESHNKIKALLAELQKKNKRNEQAIYRNQQNVNQLLAIVRGQNNQNKIYDKAGNSGMYKAQSRLGKA